MMTDAYSTQWAKIWKNNAEERNIIFSLQHLSSKVYFINNNNKLQSLFCTCFFKFQATTVKKTQFFYYNFSYLVRFSMLLLSIRISHFFKKKNDLYYYQVPCILCIFTYVFLCRNHFYSLLFLFFNMNMAMAFHTA